MKYSRTKLKRNILALTKGTSKTSITDLASLMLFSDIGSGSPPGAPPPPCSGELTGGGEPA